MRYEVYIHRWAGNEENWELYGEYSNHKIALTDAKRLVKMTSSIDSTKVVVVMEELEFSNGKVQVL